MDLVVAAQPPGQAPDTYPSAGLIHPPDGFELLACEKSDFEFRAGATALGVCDIGPVKIRSESSTTPMKARRKSSWI